MNSYQQQQCIFQTGRDADILLFILHNFDSSQSWSKIFTSETCLVSSPLLLLLLMLMMLQSVEHCVVSEDGADTRTLPGPHWLRCVVWSSVEQPLPDHTNHWWQSIPATLRHDQLVTLLTMLTPASSVTILDHLHPEDFIFNSLSLCLSDTR